MRSKDGRHPCQRCGGKGCFSCGKRGVVTRCPRCGSIEDFSARSDDLRCNSCGAVFSRGGVVTEVQTEREMEADHDFEPES